MRVENGTFTNYGSVAANIFVSGGILANRGTITQGNSNDDKVLVKSDGIFLNYGTTYKVECEEGCKYYNFGTVTYGPTPAICSHEGTFVETDAVAATCVTTGNNAYWTCSFCEKVFADEDATTETTVAAQTTAKIDHNIGEDGFCTNCTGVNAPLRASLVTASNGITVEVTAADGESDHEWECRYHKDDGPCLVAKPKLGTDVNANTTITLKSTKAFKVSFDYVLGLGQTFCYIDGTPLRSQSGNNVSGSYLNRNMSAGEHTLHFRATTLESDNYKFIISNIKATIITACEDGVHDFSDKIKEEAYLKEARNCEHGAIYYYACSRCEKNEHDDNHTYTDGVGGHTFAEGKIDGYCSVCEKNIPWYEGYDSNAEGVENAIHWEIWNTDPLEGYHTIKITGQGKMKDYELETIGWQTYSTAPWLVAYKSYKTPKGIVVGSGITHIGNYAFYGLQYINSVTISECVKSIGDNAFCQLGDGFFGRALNQLTLPASLETIGKNAFARMSVGELHFAEGSELSSIGSNAFGKIGSYGTSVDKIIFRGAAKPTIAEDAFCGLGTTTIYYPGGTGWTGVEANYGAADGNITWTTDTPPAIPDPSTPTTPTEPTDPTTPSEPAGLTPIVLTWSAENNTAISDYVDGASEFLFQFTPIETKEYVIKIENSEYNPWEILRGEVYDNEEMTTPIGIFKHNPVYSETYNKYKALAHFTLQEGTTYYIKAIYNNYLNSASNNEKTQLTITPLVYSSTEGKEVTKNWAYDDELRSLQGVTADWEFNNGDLTLKIYDDDIDSGLKLYWSYPYLVFKNQIERVIIEKTNQLYYCPNYGISDVYIPELRLPASCYKFDQQPFICSKIGKVYIATEKLLYHTLLAPSGDIPSYVDVDDTFWNNLLPKNNINDVYFLNDNVYTQLSCLIASINANEVMNGEPLTEWATLHAPARVLAKVGDAAPVELATFYSDGSSSYTFTTANVLEKGIDPCHYIWTRNGQEIEYGRVFENFTENLVLIGTWRNEPLHDYTTLDEYPEENGLYQVLCRQNPMHIKESTMAIKDYAPNATGFAKHLELTVNDQDNSYSTSKAIVLTDANQFKDVNVTFTAPRAATYTRTQSTQWSTLVLPFDINAQQTGYEFYSFRTVANDNGSSVVVLDKNLGDGNGIIAAGTSLFVLRTGGSTSLQLTATNTTVNTAITDGTLKGNYKDVALTKADDGNYFIYNDALYNANQLKAGQTVTIKAFHAYLAGEANNAAQLRIEVGGETTAIEMQEDVTSNKGYGIGYNLQGQKIAAPQRGINIIDGRKFLVK